jgi:cytochrome P450
VKIFASYAVPFKLYQEHITMCIEQTRHFNSCVFQVVKETLRMSNVLLWFPRVALNDCTIEGRFLLRGIHIED